MIPFRNRSEAGRELASVLEKYRHWPDLLVLGLPRGGVPVAYEVAAELGVPLDLFIVRKLGVPGQEELAMGAIASGGIRLLNRDLIASLRVPDALVADVTEKEMRELERREASYRAQLPPLDPAGRSVLLVDDGLATGYSMHAAVSALREKAPQRIVVAVPVSSPRTAEEFVAQVDDVVCVATPEPFYAVGQWYEDFSQTTDEQVRDILDRAAHLRESA